jgi:hypothetical protein
MRNTSGLMSDQYIFNRFARLLMAEGDPAPGGGSPPAAVTAPPADGGAAPAAGAAPVTDTAPASEPKSLLSDAKAPDAPAPVVETPEQKAERIKNETPEQKTAREAQEAKDAETAKAARTEALKPYNELKLPEGMPADQPAFADFKEAALDLGVEPAKAQKLIDTVAPKMKEAIEAPYNLWADTQVEWVDTIKKDPELGGAKLEENLAVAALALDKYGTPEESVALRKALAFTGAGNNPEIFRWMLRVGKTLKEGTPVQARAAASEKPSLASRMYPSSNPQTA